MTVKTKARSDTNEHIPNAHVWIEKVGGRELRVATWRLDEKSEHPPLLFFNGIGANIEAVAPLAQDLAERPFIVFDMPGVGGSPAPVVPYNIVTMAWTASRLLAQLGIDQVDVMGVSWGGGMAQHFALQHPGLVRNLVLAATTPGMLMVPGKPQALSKMRDPKRYTDPEFMNENFATLYGGVDRDGTAHQKDDHIGRLKPPTKRGYFYQMMAMFGWTSAPFLPMLSKRTLVMMGDDDRLVPVINGRILASLIPNARLEIFSGGGHLFLLTHADETVPCLREFLDETAPEVANA